MIDMVQVTAAIIWEFICGLLNDIHLTSAHFKVRVKVVHILTVNIFEMVTCRKTLILPSNRKSCVGFRFSYLHLTLTHFKGHGNAYFNCDFLENGDIRKALLLQSYRKSCIGL